MGVFLFALGLAAAAWSIDDAPVWHSDWPTAQRSAQESNKPIFAVLVCKH
ncbi:MAG: hypothetical protein HYR84_15905 [Planctomycetes bacterium]|nr:hypothetical protein [Planctomycetota bacterium]